MRGVVISPPFEFDQNGTLPIIQGGLPINEITKYLLYFDKIDIPDNGFVSVDLSPEIEFLVQEKIVERTRIGFNITESGPVSYHIPEGSDLPGFQIQGSFSFNEIGMFPILAQLATYTLKNTQSDCIWSLVQLANAPYFPNAKLSDCLDIQLYNSLPIPREDTPFDVILEFKERERQSLSDLRGYLDELHTTILSSSDREKTISLCADRISRDVTNVIQRMNRKNIRYYLGHTKFLIFTAAAIEIGQELSTPIATIAASMLGLMASKALQPSEIANQPNQQAQLVYLKKAQETRII